MFKDYNLFFNLVEVVEIKELKRVEQFLPIHSGGSKGTENIEWFLPIQRDHWMKKANPSEIHILQINTIR